MERKAGNVIKVKSMITTVDAHVEGEAIRLVTGGVPYIPGKTMVEKNAFAQKTLDYLRTSLNYEPRGHNAMFTGILTPPVTENASYGILFASQIGYANMCGHASMGIAAIAVETGIVEPKEPVTEIAFDTPAGTAHARVNIEGGRIKSVTIQNVPSFLYKTVRVKLPGLGDLYVDVVYGGNFFAIVQMQDIGIKPHVDDIQRAAGLLTQIKEDVEQQVNIQHPELGSIKGIRLFLLNDKPRNPKADILNIACTSYGTCIGRSPSGTATSAKMAALYSKGQLGLGETFITESIIGSLFYGKLVKELSVGSFKAVLPEVTGRVFITGRHNFVIDEDDPFKYGFQI